jgi:hypothetical protein
VGVEGESSAPRDLLAERREDSWMTRARLDIVSREEGTWSTKSTGGELCRGRVHLGIFIHLYFPKKRTSAT